MTEAGVYFSPVCQSTTFSPWRSSVPRPWCSGATSWGETSKVVVLLTRERGKLRAVATRGPRGAQRYQSALEPLSEVRATLYGRQGTELFRLGPVRAGALGVSRRTPGSQRALVLRIRRADRRFLPGGARPRTPCTAWRWRCRPRPRTDGPGAVLSRYIEAWLLRLHRPLSTVDRCAAAAAWTGGSWPITPPRTASCAPSASGHGAYPAGRRTGPAPNAYSALRPRRSGTTRRGVAALEAFHHQLIRGHLERAAAFVGA